MSRSLAVGVVAALVAGPAIAQDRVLAVQWEGIQGLVAGVMSSDGTGRSRLRVQHPGVDRECAGTLSLSKGGADGSWALACPGGLAASGTFVATRPGREPEGVGTDTAGRQVSFIVGPRLGQAPAAKPAPNVSSASPPPEPAIGRKDATADELNQAEIERQRAARHEELQREVRRNHEEAEAARAAKPPPAAAEPTAPLASAMALPLSVDAKSEQACGFFRIQGLSLRSNTIKCEESQRSGQGGRGNATIARATFGASLQPSNAFLSIGGERDVEGIGGFASTSPKDLMTLARSWGSTRGGRNYVDAVGSPFQHVKLNISQNGSWGCAYGTIEGNRRAWGTSASRSYVLVIYCEPGAQQVSPDNLQKIGTAIRLD